MKPLKPEEKRSYIATCHICIIAPALRCCNVCKFNIGIDSKELKPFPHDLWICKCREIRHKSVLVCAFCHTDQPERIKNVPALESNRI